MRVRSCHIVKHDNDDKRKTINDTINERDMIIMNALNEKILYWNVW